MAKNKIEKLRNKANLGDQPICKCHTENGITENIWNTDYVLFLEKRILKLEKKLKKLKKK